MGTIEDIARYKTCKRANIEKAKADVRRVESLAGDINSPERNMWNLHYVPVNGTTYLVADAKYLNKHTNQRGRGNLRIMLDRGTYEYAGLARELDNGNYRLVA